MAYRDPVVSPAQEKARAISEKKSSGTVQKEDFAASSFNTVRLAMASPDQILEWSHGEVTKPETINYRTQKPEKDGLFDERIFGPTKDWECYCGKYKRIRYKGVVCDKCGVEVTRSIVRRERMAHIKLTVPVAHIWFVRGTPSTIGLLLNLSVRDLERVIYFANFIIEEVNEDARKEALAEIDKDFKQKKELTQKELDDEIKAAKAKAKTPEDKAAIEKLQKEKAAVMDEIDAARSVARSEIQSLSRMQIISELKYHDWSMKYGHLFKAGIGGEAILRLLEQINLEKLMKELRHESETAAGAKQKKALKRLRLVEGMVQAKLKSDWAVLKVLPVIPPDLRPMVQLDGGRFAASDLNDLYRRVINRNNRLKRLIELDAPEVIQRNEKRMLQEAVDALIDNNARRERSVSVASTKRKLKSLADMLKGKQGRFRQNLLGKRVDYSGRSVIVVGPQLKLSECGIPKTMALELFKPFVMSKLITDGLAHNVKSASRMIERGFDEVWDALEEIIKDKLVLLNRAPTLHRLGIQAFRPLLIEGKAIQIHPLVCAAFNADFDGDQMAVHVPLSVKAQWEARHVMFSIRNLLKPASGEPIINPDRDMVLGIYWLTLEREGLKGEGKVFSNIDEAVIAYQSGIAELQAKVKIEIAGSIVDTTVGRILFNESMPSDEFVNETINSKKLKALIRGVFEKYGEEAAVIMADKVKDLGFEFSTLSGISIGIDDIEVPEEKGKVIKDTEDKVVEVNKQYQMGLITETERYEKVVEHWTHTIDTIRTLMRETMDPMKPIALMMHSGARGDITQVLQLAGMKGLVVNPSGQIIERPIRSNYKEGFTVLEYFISTHGARKGGADTALRTADSGYLTRRMVDVAQDVIVDAEDCKDTKGYTLFREDSRTIGEELWKFENRVFGRFLAEDVKSKSGKVLAKKGELIDELLAVEISNSGVEELLVRSPLSCKSVYGVCRKCYGLDLARNEVVEMGEAVGIIAAQSIGEPGTQLTMRTFHTGGVVGLDITQGLPRVEELFEARVPKGLAPLAEIDGRVDIQDLTNKKIITIYTSGETTDTYKVPAGLNVLVKEGAEVRAKGVLASGEAGSLRAKISGKVKKISKTAVEVSRPADIREYTVPLNATMRVKKGEDIEAGTQLIDGSLNLKDLYLYRGKQLTMRYIIAEVQQIYVSQGQSIHDKHVEAIVKQMFSRVRVDNPGDSGFISGQIVSRGKLLEENSRLRKEKKKLAFGEALLLPIVKVALSTDSFLSAASFQETTRVLIGAAVRGAVDKLRGLKENVIIGRLIPVGTGFRKDIFDELEAVSKEEAKLEGNKD